MGGSTAVGSEDSQGAGFFSTNIFQKARTDDEVLGSHFVEITPSETLHDDIPALTFVVPQTHMPLYTSLAEIYMGLKLAITKTNTLTGQRAAVVAEDNVRPIDRIADSLWSKVSQLGPIVPDQNYNMM